MDTDPRAHIVLEALWKREAVIVKIPVIQQKISREVALFLICKG